MTKILSFSGSSRSASLNAELAAYAARLVQDSEATATLASLSDYEMPLYNGDLEEEHGVPEGVRRFRDLLADQDGFLVACPEYNGSITPLLKNTIDWTSRPDGDAPGLLAYRGKVAGLVSASPGALGGLRGLVHVRAILSGIGVHVIPTQFALSGAHAAFDETGALEDDGLRAQLQGVVSQLVDTARRLRA